MKGSVAAAGAAFLIALTSPIWVQQPAPASSIQVLPTPADAIPQIEPLAPHQQGAALASAQETHPRAKTLASEIALAMTQYEAHEEAGEIAARLAPWAGSRAGELASVLHNPGSWSRGRVIYPQLGGLTDDKTSVMVVVEQMIGEPGGVRIEIRTLDIRLAISGGVWQFDQLASDGGTPLLPPSQLSPEALAVLNDPRIEMPDSARWDIFAGDVSPRLLAVMARMAEVTPFGVVTLISGHPFTVFGTDRQSSHMRGLAVDVYRIGDRLVIDDRVAGSPTHELVRWLYDQPEVVNIGSPWALDGLGGRSFTDAVHQDHLHIAVYPD